MLSTPDSIDHDLLMPPVLTIANLFFNQIMKFAKKKNNLNRKQIHNYYYNLPILNGHGIVEMKRKKINKQNAHKWPTLF